MAFDPSAVRPPGVFSTNPAYQGAWICYINGIYVPITGFEVESAVWQVPSFRIHLVPDVLLARLGAEDRVPVQLFYLDQWHTPGRPEFRLLADGEIVGWSYSNASGGRSMAFSCAANIHLYQQLYFHFMTNVDDIVASRSPDMVATTLGSQPGLIYPYALFHQGLLSTERQVGAATPPAPPRRVAGTPTTQEPIDTSTDDAAQVTKPIETPYEFVYNVVKGCISSNVPVARRAVPMMNFFARHIRKSRLHNRFVRLPLLEDPARLAARVGVFPIFNAARNLEALNAMQRHVASQVGNAGPVWNLVQQTLGLVNMEVAMIPGPCSVTVQLNDTTGGANTNPTEGRIIGPPEGYLGADDGRTVSKMTPIRLAQNFVKPTMHFATPPHCNAIFPSMFASGGWMFDENFTAQPTRNYVNDSVMTQLLRADGNNREFMLHALTVGYPEEADALMHHKIGSSTGDEAGGPVESGKNLLIWPEEFFKGPVVSRSQLPAWFQFLRQFSNSQAGPIAAVAPPNEPIIGPTPVGTTATTDPLTNVAGPPVVAPANPDRRGGRATPVLASTRPEAQFDFPYRWQPTDEALRRGQSQNTAYRQYRVRDVPQLELNRAQRGTEALREFLYQRFPRTFNRDSGTHDIEAARPARRVHINPNPNKGVDDHVAGIALDLMVPTKHEGRVRRPDLEVGAPIANWLIENAATLGIAYITYGRSTWSGDGFSGWGANHRGGERGFSKFKHFSGAANSEKMDHFDHIHVTLTRESALGLTGVLARGNSAHFTSPASVTVVNRPVRRPAAMPQPGTQGGVPEAVVTTEATTPELTPEQTAQADSFATLFRLYAQEDYLRQRYSQRTTGANLCFNPYIVAGFPAMIFDSMATGMHAVGYVQGVAHAASVQGSGSISTQVRLSFCRTIYEFIGDVKADALRFAGRVTSAPAELISEIREVVQDEGNAEVFYSKLLHGGRPTPSGAALRWTEVLGYADGVRSYPIEITGDSVAEVEARLRNPAGAATAATNAAGRADALAAQTQAAATLAASDDPDEAAAGAAALSGLRAAAPVITSSAAAAGVTNLQGRQLSTNLDPNRELAPRENIYADAFASHDVAMHLCARPACTLDEYVRFWHADKSLAALQQDGQVGPVRTDFSYVPARVGVTTSERTGADGTPEVQYSQTARGTAGFYDRIFLLRPGPGGGEDHMDEPTPEERGYTDPPNITPTAVTRGLPANYPETRADWDKVLLAYRDKVHLRVSPST